MGGAVLLAAGTFLTRRLMGQENILAWARARAAAEALKREGYKCAAKAAPYEGDDAVRLARLNEEREKIEEAVDELINRAVAPRGRGSMPTSDITPQEYIDRRVRKQVEEFYEPKAERYRKLAAWLGWAEFGLAFAATIIATVVGSTDKTATTDTFFGFDLIALTAVLTTVAGAIVAHVEASRYDFLVMIYRATARRLRNEIARASKPSRRRRRNGRLSSIVAKRSSPTRTATGSPSGRGNVATAV